MSWMCIPEQKLIICLFTASKGAHAPNALEGTTELHQNRGVSHNQQKRGHFLSLERASAESLAKIH